MSEDRSPSRRAAALAIICGLAVAIRLALIALAARSLQQAPAGFSTRDLALFYDGPLYFLVARSFPTPYLHVEPLLRGMTPETLTVWFPVYPFFIWLTDKALGSLQYAAMTVSIGAGLAAIVIFERVSRRCVDRPLLATVLFAVFPPTWLVTSSLSFSEPVLLAFAVAAFACFQREKHAAAALLGGLAAVTQKHGVLVPLWMVMTVALMGRRPRVRTIGLYALAGLPALLLQTYLFFAFGDPLVNLRATREVFGGTLFGLPALSFLGGCLALPALGGVPDWLQRMAMLSSLLFYVGALVRGLRSASDRTRPLVLWLGTVLVFTLCLGGPWAYYAFPRYMLLGAPPAALLWIATPPARSSSRCAAPAFVAIGALGAVSLWAATQAIGAAISVSIGMGGGPYLSWLRQQLH